MKRATITLPDDLEGALEAYCQDQEVAPPMTTVVQAALRHYLMTRGYLPPVQPLVITPAKQGSGQHDVSLQHDRYLANQ